MNFFFLEKTFMKTSVRFPFDVSIKLPFCHLAVIMDGHRYKKRFRKRIKTGKKSRLIVILFIKWFLLWKLPPFSTTDDSILIKYECVAHKRVNQYKFIEISFNRMIPKPVLPCHSFFKNKTYNTYIAFKSLPWTNNKQTQVLKQVKHELNEIRNPALVLLYALLSSAYNVEIIWWF